jgi:hypothetical protein
LTYRPVVDGVPVGETQSTRLALPADLADGEHTWTVTATDRRGQTAVSKPGTLRVDATPPTLSFRVRGVKSAGRTLSLATKAADPAPGSSLLRTVISFGEGERVFARNAKHVFAKGGKYTLRISATDKAGNSTVLRQVITIAKKKKSKKN